MIFISIVLLLAFGINLYVLTRLSGFFGIERSPYFWIVVCVLTVSLIGATIYEALVGNTLSRVLYVVSANWLGILWLLFSCMVVYEILRLFVKLSPPVWGVVIIGTVATATIYSMINAQVVRVRRVRIPGGVDVDIVQISDIHLGSVNGRFLETIVARTNALDGDVVLITGDLVDNNNKRTRRALNSLNALEAPVFFVTGNHEGYIGPEKVKRALNKTKVRVLENEVAEFGQVQIIGISDGSAPGHVERELKRLNVDKSKFTVLMYHQPVEMEAVSHAGIDLMLAGHTHDGQLFPFNYVVRLMFKHMKGLHKYGDSYLYVTTGTGTWGPRMRLGSNCEIVLLEVRTCK